MQKRNNEKGSGNNIFKANLILKKYLSDNGFNFTGYQINAYEIFYHYFKVQPQQEIAAIGVSGSSFFPHLHFELRTSVAHGAEGLPSYFSKVYLLEGDKKIKLKSGLVETGNIIEAK